MIVMRVTGGLGNQMFQYAAGRQLAHKHGVELRLDLSFYREQIKNPGRGSQRRYQLNRFKIAAGWVMVAANARMKLPRHGTPAALDQPKLAYVQQRGSGTGIGYAPWFEEIPPHAYVDGFWQSDGFFAPIADAIRREFEPADPADLPSEDWTRMAREAVAVHVRRGDYLKFPDLFHITSKRYFAEAMALFDDRYWFAVFSDDPDWCRANFEGANVRIMPMDDAVRDLYRMAACAHVIMANSSYSWWGGWLNRNPGRRVVVPWPWIASPKSRSTPQSMFPPDWTVLPV
jgi:hypothetical protein